MIIKIDQVGHLHIGRREGLVAQYCPRAQENVRCGDWCPLFGEPFWDFDLENENDDIAVNKGLGSLTICERILTTTPDQLIDERDPAGTP